MKKPILYLTTFHKDTIYGQHALYDPDEETRLTSIFGTNDDAEKKANEMYGKHYNIISTPIDVEPKSDFGEYMKVIYRYRKGKSTKVKSKSKRKCRCKK